MLTLANFTTSIDSTVVGLTSLASTNPLYSSQFSEFSARLNAIKVANTNAITSLIPSIGTFVSNSTAVSGFLGSSLVSCANFDKYVKSLESMVDISIMSTVNDTITNAINNPSVSPITDTIVNINNALLNAEQFYSNTISEALATQAKINSFINSFVGIMNMLRNPCTAMTFLANSNLIGELNPTIQMQANHAMDIVGEVGKIGPDISVEVQGKIIEKAKSISGF